MRPILFGLMISVASLALAPTDVGAAPRRHAPTKASVFARAPNEAQLLETLPLRARTEKVSGHVRVRCVVPPVDTEEPWSLYLCESLAEEPKGYGLADSARIAASTLFALHADTRTWPWRRVELDLHWSLRDSTERGPHGERAWFDAARPSLIPKGEQALAPPPIQVRQAVAPDPDATPDPVDPKLERLGACVWDAIGAAGQAEVVDYAASWARPRPDSYWTQWPQQVRACDSWTPPQDVEEHEALKRDIAIDYVVMRARGVLLERAGGDVGRAAQAYDDAPVSVWAVLKGYHRPGPDDGVWSPVYRRLGLTPDQVKAQGALLGAWLAARRDYQHELLEALGEGGDYGQTYYGMRAPPLSAPEIAAPRFARTPSKAELAASFPATALDRHISATTVVDCLVTPSGKLSGCRVQSVSPAEKEVEDAGRAIAECCYGLDLESAKDRQAIGRVVRVVVSWPFGD